MGDFYTKISNTKSDQSDNSVRVGETKPKRNLFIHFEDRKTYGRITLATKRVLIPSDIPFKALFAPINI